jgi:hypothetical protein
MALKTLLKLATQDLVYNILRKYVLMPIPVIRNAKKTGVGDPKFCLTKQYFVRM